MADPFVITVYYSIVCPLWPFAGQSELFQATADIEQLVPAAATQVFSQPLSVMSAYLTPSMFEILNREARQICLTQHFDEVPCRTMGEFRNNVIVKLRASRPLLPPLLLRRVNRRVMLANLPASFIDDDGR